MTIPILQTVEADHRPSGRQSRALAGTFSAVILVVAAVASLNLGLNYATTVMESLTSMTIDGATVGARRCAGEQDAWEIAQCGRFQSFALTSLEQVRPNHTPITSTEVYRDPKFENKFVVRSGYGDLAYVVIRQADGTTTALHIRAGAGTNANICFLLPPYGDTTSDGECPGPDPQ